MDYSSLVETYQKVEATTKRLEMIDLLAELLRGTPAELMGRVIYLTQGKVYPDFVGVELGIGEKVILRAIHIATGIDQGEVQSAWLKRGDLGLVAEEMVSRKKQRPLFSEPLTTERVYSNMERIARASGGGSVDLKMRLLAELLHDSSPVEARYIIRTVDGRLRLGIADMTIVEGLAAAFAGREAKDAVEAAYNVCSDLGLVGETLARDGLDGVRSIGMKVGVPLRSMLAERLTSIGGIFEKMGGECAFEYKYDGLRVQAHIDGGRVDLFSRHLENITPQFPDVVEVLGEAFTARSAIVEGECVPVNLVTGEMRPFQEISHRRGRKYELKGAVEEYPVAVFLFDCMYLDGEELLDEDYPTRRGRLASAIKETERVRLSTSKVLSSVEEAELFFEGSIEAGCEGIMAKSISGDSTYRAGARGWQWIKYKRDYKAEMSDTVDLVVVGAFAGRGKRAGVYGGLLMATYNKEEDSFETVCKIGTGFSDEVLAEIPGKLERLRLDRPHQRVESEMEADFWFVPELVMEVRGAEVTLSPIHTCARGEVRKGSGMAIRFPRFTGRWRDDKSPEDATTSQEVVGMYNSQLKRVGG